MQTPIPEKQREFAIDVVRQLRDRGFEAYWAGGCVRDQLLQRTPYDYDVATSAQPPEIERVFHKRKTISVGAAFGVIAVVGPRGAGQIEVTTFRQDISYSDGRHPDRVAFSSPEEDAKRRDFTINGMFYDPLQEQIIDFVGGQADLQNGMIRAIGNPHERFTEDKLRMLRAVRFAAVFDFRFDSATLAAIEAMADQITVVSAERIAAEMRILLTIPHRVRAVELLRDTRLLHAILPEATESVSQKASGGDSFDFDGSLALLGAVQSPTFPLAVACLLRAAPEFEVAETIGRRWRLARKEIDRAKSLIEHRSSLDGAAKAPWSQVQPLLIDEGARELVELYAAKAQLGLANDSDVEFARAKLNEPAEILNPPPLLTGEDLKTAGVPQGPEMARLLKAVRAAQLDGQVVDRDSAIALIRHLWKTNFH